MTDHPRAVFETYVAGGLEPADALKEMQKEARAVLNWATTRSTKIIQGSSHDVEQPSINEVDVETHVSYIADATDGWLSRFHDSIRHALERELAESPEVYAHVVIVQGSRADLRTRVSGYVADIVDNHTAIRFLDGVAVSIEDVREMAL